MFYIWSFPENINGLKLEYVEFGLIEGVQPSPTRSIDEITEGTIKVLAETAEETPGGRIARNMLECP